MVKTLMTITLACGSSFEGEKEDFEEVSRGSRPGFDFGGFIYKVNDEEHHLFKPSITSISYRPLYPTVESDKSSKTKKKKKNGKNE